MQVDGAIEVAVVVQGGGEDEVVARPGDAGDQRAGGRQPRRLGSVVHEDVEAAAADATEPVELVQQTIDHDRRVRLRLVGDRRVGDTRVPSADQACSSTPVSTLTRTMLSPVVGRIRISSPPCPASEAQARTNASEPSGSQRGALPSAMGRSSIQIVDVTGSGVVTT